MRVLHSKKFLLLTMVGVIVLVVGLTGFAFSRGYLMRFIVDDIELSRDEYFARAEEAMAGRVSVYCAQAEFSLSEGYVIHCFDTPEEVTAFMTR